MINEAMRFTFMTSYEFKEERKKVEKGADEKESKITEEEKTTEAPEAHTKDIAATGGEAVGKGIEKVKNVVSGFTAGVSKGMKGEEVHQETQITQEATPKVVEEEKVKKKEIKQS